MTTNPTPTRPEPTTPTREELLNAAADLLQAKSDEHGRIALDNNAALPSETHRIIQHTYAYAAALVRHMDSEPAASAQVRQDTIEECALIAAGYPAVEHGHLISSPHKAAAQASQEIAAAIRALSPSPVKAGGETPHD